MGRRAALASVLACAVVMTSCGGGTSSAPATTATTTPSRPAGCRHVSQPKPHAPEALTGPPTQLDASKRWTLTFRTSCGSFAVVLQPRTSPHAAASLVALARKGYFDGTIFHRIVPGFVIQGGDPTQTGSGGPGYTTVDTPKADTRYVRGTVAMAKTATEPPGTAGSQFFVMTADAPTLPADYAVVGRVASGADVVRRIGKLGDASDPNGTPTQVVVVERVAVSSQ